MADPKLHDYQKRAVALIGREKTVFLMADVGLGKTAMALHAIDLTKRPGLVMAPITPCYTTWPDEVKKWTPHMNYTILHGPRKLMRAKLKRHLYFLPYSSLKWYYEQCVTGKIPMRQMFLVLDESSFVKNPSTKRFKMLKKMFAIFPEWRLCLSATPSAKGLENLWSQTYMLDKGQRLFSSYYRFRDRYFWYTGPPRYETNPKPEAEEALYTAIADITFRLDGDDYLELPDVTYNKINLKLPPTAQKFYDNLEKNFCSDLLDAPVSAVNTAALGTKLRQVVQGAVYTDEGTTKFIHNAKVDVLKEMLEGAAGNPILCPIEFKFEPKLIEKRLNKKVPVIAGGTPARMKEMYIREWNKGNIPLLLCHPASMGHGTNLQAGGHIVLWFGLTWNLEYYQQLNGRLARQGQRHAVVINHLLAEGTIDGRVFEVLRLKNATQRKLLDSLRDYAKENY